MQLHVMPATTAALIFSLAPLHGGAPWWHQKCASAELQPTSGAESYQLKKNKIAASQHHLSHGLHCGAQPTLQCTCRSLAPLFRTVCNATHVPQPMHQPQYCNTDALSKLCANLEKNISIRISTQMVHGLSTANIYQLPVFKQRLPLLVPTST